jgi:broad specificity phosphatase PhoE
MASTKTTVHFLRHGEVHNPTGVLYGRLPGFKLSALGEQMAEAVAKSLAERDITHIYSSPLERAVQTAQPSATALGLPIETDLRLVESENWFEGRTVGFGPRVWPKLINPIRPSWGEPYQHIAERMRDALHDIRDAARGHEALAVSHQLPIWELRLFLTGRPLWHNPRKRQCALASLTSFRYEGTSLVGIDYSEPAAHLGPGKGIGA